MDIIYFLYKVISLSSKGAMSSSESVLLLKSGGGGELFKGGTICRLWHEETTCGDFLWMLSPTNETELSYASRAYFKWGSSPRLPSSKCSLSRIALDPGFAHFACRKRLRILVRWTYLLFWDPSSCRNSLADLSTLTKYFAKRGLILTRCFFPLKAGYLGTLKGRRRLRCSFARTVQG